MGFGSYDESEQDSQNVDTSEGDAVDVHESEFEGDVEFDTEATTEQLVDRLGEMRNADEES